MSHEVINHLRRRTMVKVFALWSRPNDTAAFDRDYMDRHVPLAKKVPGLEGFFTGKSEGADAPYYRIAELRFEDASTLDASMTSEEMAAVVADVGELQTSHGATMTLLTISEDGK
jgi:uncharacterized protein (TIGR02118 family)